MVVLINLPQCLAQLQVLLVVVRPVLLAAIYRYAAVRALELHMCGRPGGPAAGLARLEVSWRGSNAGLVVRGVRAVGMMLHEGGAFADGGHGRGAEAVEEVIWLKDHVGVRGSFDIGGRAWLVRSILEDALGLRCWPRSR